MEQKKPTNGSVRNLQTMVTILLILIAGIGITLIALMAGNCSRRELPSEQAVQAATVSAQETDPDAVLWEGSVASGEGEAAGGKGIRIPGYPTLNLPANTVQVPVFLLNPEGNPCYFRFSLTLSETDEVLCNSGLVPPGHTLQSMTLSRPLDPGSYEAVIGIATFSMEDQAPMNGANVHTTLIVKEETA